MSLALVTVQPDDFDLVYEHLVAHKPKYRNMHMRKTCNPNDVRTLRYLHAMYADIASKRIDGMISGPAVFWRYQLIRTHGHSQINVLREIADPPARNRILKRFVSEILRRVQDEQLGNPSGRPNYSSGQYYLRRRIPGMDSTHQHCIDAVREGVLARAFVSQLASWNFEIVHPDP